MTEDDIRRIVREEIERAKEPPTYRGVPLPPNSPMAPSYPQPYIPMHPTYYPWTSGTPFRVT